MSRKEEKDALMEKVFGKSNYSITENDIEALNQASLSFSNDLEEMLEKSKKDNQKLDELLEAANQVVINNNKIIEKNTAKNLDLEDLRKQIIQDFGEKAIEENELLISYNQSDLYQKFIEIEEELNEEIACQKEYHQSLCKAFRRPFVMGQQKSGLGSSILITGEANTGRHTSLQTICKLCKEKEIISNDKVTILDMSKYQNKEDENNFVIDLYSAIQNSNVIAFDQIESTGAFYLTYMEQILLEAKLSLNKRYTLSNQQLVETSTSLNKDTISELSFVGKNLVFISNTKVSILLNVFGSRFVNGLSDILETSDIGPDEILDVFENKLTKNQKKFLNQLNMELQVEDSLRQYVKDHYDGSNCQYINHLYENIYSACSEYKLSNPFDEKMLVSLKAEDEIFFNGNRMSDYLPKGVDNAIEEVRKELDNIVGLTEIKEYIFSLQDFYAAQKLKQAQGMNTSEISKHMIFTGNPGTGKTTIARLLAKYLKAINVLTNGQLVEVTRNDLVGKYVGHTAPQTMKVIDSAIGGILFIDEAYSLYRGDNDSFGLECIDTLVKAMEDNRENLIVILAGYTKEMKEFLTSNSGLQSRFPNQIEFPDYTGEELYEIAKINAKSAGYQIDEKAKEPLIAYFTKVQKNDAVRSGNGRLSRNLVEKAIMKQSSRILKDNGQLDLLLLEDFALE